MERRGRVGASRAIESSLEEQAEVAGGTAGKRVPGISVDVSVVHAELVEPCTTASTDATCSTASTAEDAARRHADWVERRMLIQFGGREYGRVEEYWHSFWGDQLQFRV